MFVCVRVCVCVGVCICVRVVCNRFVHLTTDIRVRAQLEGEVPALEREREILSTDYKSKSKNLKNVLTEKGNQ